MKKFGVGIQLYGVRNALSADFEGTLRALSELGYEYVEFAGNYGGKSGEEIKALLDKYNLKCVSVHQGVDFLAEKPEEKISFLKSFGVKFFVQPWYDAAKLADSPVWEETKTVFQNAAHLLKKNGMLFGYHNHEFEFRTFGGKYLHDYIFEAVPVDEIVPELDTCWVRYAGLDPAEKLRQFKGRVPVVHLKDFTCKHLAAGPVYDLIDEEGGSTKKPATREENGFEFRPLGRGMQDFAKILNACEECGTDVVIVEQDQVYDGMTELEAARISREYLKETFGL